MIFVLLGILILAHRLWSLKTRPFAWWPTPVPLPEQHAWNAGAMLAGGMAGALGFTVFWVGALLPQVQSLLESAPENARDAWTAFGGGMAFQMGALAGMLLPVRISTGSWSGALGPWLPPWKSANALRSARHLIGAYPILMGAYYLWTKLLELFEIPVVDQTLVELFRTESGIAPVAALLFMIVVCAPVVEELFFRGLLYPALRTKLGPWGAALASSLAFSAIHYHAAGFVPFLLLGIVLCRLTETTRDIRAAILAHALFNLNTAVGLLLQASSSSSGG